MLITNGKWDMAEKKFALFLSGGGAKAAYQVGVLKAIASWYPRHSPSPFRIYCGTSAGAINATALSCYSHHFKLAVCKLHWMWRQLHTERIFTTSPYGVGHHLIGQLGSRFTASHLYREPFSILDNQPLAGLLDSMIDYQRLSQELKGPFLDAIAITASSYHSRSSVTFFQDNQNYLPWTKAKSKGRRTLINRLHLLASAAIPLILPAVKIGRYYYGDGAVNQLSPLFPALHFGADKILTIDLTWARKEERQPNRPARLATIGGHILDSLFSHTIQWDLEQLNNKNQILENLSTAQKNRTALKHVDAMLIQPSISFESFCVIAS